MKTSLRVAIHLGLSNMERFLKWCSHLCLNWRNSKKAGIQLVTPQLTQDVTAMKFLRTRWYLTKA